MTSTPPPTSPPDGATDTIATSADTELRRLRIVAVVEATTLVVLVLTALWRRFLDGPDLSSILGPIHGVAFAAYFVSALRTQDEQGWRVVRTAAIVLAAIVPVGGYLVAARLTDRAAS